MIKNNKTKSQHISTMATFFQMSISSPSFKQGRVGQVQLMAVVLPDSAGMLVPEAVKPFLFEGVVPAQTMEGLKHHPFFGGGI